MAPTFEHLREADLDDDEFNDDEIDTSDLRERFEVQLEQGYDSFVVVDGLPKVNEEQKPKLVKFLLKKLNTVGKTREDMIHMPMGDDGQSLRYDLEGFPLRPVMSKRRTTVSSHFSFTVSHLWNTPPPVRLPPRRGSWTWFLSTRSTHSASTR
jgi:hypothetical protein